MSTKAPPRRSPMHERFRARRRTVAQQQARRRRRVVLSLLALVALTGLVGAAVRSPLFSITDVRVAGVGPEREDDVRAAAGIMLGDNLLFADLRTAEERAAGLPWVRDVTARRIPPSVVELRVRLREAVAVLVTDTGSWLVDLDGVVLAGGARPGLPEITLPETAPLRVGEPVADEAVTNALTVHRELPGPLRSLVVRYDAPTVPGLRLLLDAGGGAADADHVWVRFGPAQRVDAKARVTGLLLAETRNRDGGQAYELDVRAPGNPVLVPAPVHPDGGGA